MHTFRGLTAIRTGTTLAAIVAVILAGVFSVFRAEATGLSEVRKLVASDASVQDHFGFSVAVSGDTTVVRALDQNDGGSSVGAAYVFERDQGGPNNWGNFRSILRLAGRNGSSPSN